jgi:hypothetical protein
MNPKHRPPIESPVAVASRIRRLAKKDNLIAQKSRKDGKWYFADLNNFLMSPEQGLDDLEALAFLEQESPHD